MKLKVSFINFCPFAQFLFWVFSIVIGKFRCTMTEDLDSENRDFKLLYATNISKKECEVGAKTVSNN